MVEGGNDVWARFLSAGDDRRPLHRVLMERGLSEAQSRAVESDIAPGCLLLTVYGEDNPQRVADILADDNGDVISPLGETPRAVELASRDPRTGVDPKQDDSQSEWDLDAADGDDDGFVTEEFIATGRDRVARG